tara:strand:+ start:77 stop:838 length:762 start_codon:yes stop_codon:yes gene_type:complete
MIFCKNIFFIIILILFSSCTTYNLVNDKKALPKVNSYTNKGFALIYNESLFKKKIVSRKISERNLIIFQKNLKLNTRVKITNLLNNKSIIATVGKNSIYPSFYNSVLSLRIAHQLKLDINQPYVEIFEILENSVFIAKKTKTYDEEKNVAVKAPVNSISINDLNEVKNNNKKNFLNKFSYNIKIADFYFNETALMMVDRINAESSAKNPKIEKITHKKYRVYLGPFYKINSLQNSYNDISILKFDNIEIIQND